MSFGRQRRTILAASVAVGAAIAAVGGLCACSAVLGFDPFTLDTGEGGAPGEGGPIGEGGSLLDGQSPTDAAVDAPTCKGDLSSDPSNCGHCGRDCLGAKCTMSQCEAIRLADGLAQPEGLVVSKTDVFVAEYYINRIATFANNTLAACITPGSSACGFTETMVGKPTAMGIDGTNVYWANTSSGGQEIRSCPLAGCGANTPTLVAALTSDGFDHLNGNGLLPLDLIVKGGTIFWPENTNGAIRSAPAAGGGTIKTYFESGNYAPVAIAVDDQRIFFTDEHIAEIEAVPLAGGSVAIVRDSEARPYGLALTATGSLFWTIPLIAAAGDGKVEASAKTADGGLPVGAIATQQNDPRAVMVDGNNVYWTVTGDVNAPTGLVVYCPQTGCPADGPIVLAKDQRVPKHLAQDATAIYWCNEGLANSQTFDGQVWKIAKP